MSLSPSSTSKLKLYHCLLHRFLLQWPFGIRMASNVWRCLTLTWNPALKTSSLLQMKAFRILFSRCSSWECLNDLIDSHIDRSSPTSGEHRRGCQVVYRFRLKFHRWGKVSNACVQCLSFVFLLPIHSCFLDLIQLMLCFSSSLNLALTFFKLFLSILCRDKGWTELIIRPCQCMYYSKVVIFPLWRTK